jgi:hypothetical protein
MSNKLVSDLQVSFDTSGADKADEEAGLRPKPLALLGTRHILGLLVAIS